MSTSGIHHRPFDGRHLVFFSISIVLELVILGMAKLPWILKYKINIFQKVFNEYFMAEYDAMTFYASSL